MASRHADVRFTPPRYVEAAGVRAARARTEEMMAQLQEAGKRAAERQEMCPEVPWAGPHEGVLAEDGKAAYPFMTPQEAAEVSVPADAPAERFREVLGRHGACIVTGVLNAEECSLLQRMWLNDLTQLVDEEAAAGDAGAEGCLARFRRDGLDGIPKQSYDDLGAMGPSCRGLPHGGFAWACRLHPNVRASFAKFYDVAPGELAVGTDVVFWSPKGTSPPTGKEWLHCDQNVHAGRSCDTLQGFVYVWGSADPDASTAVVVPGSHRPECYDKVMADKHAADKGRRGGHFVQVNRFLDPVRKSELLTQAVRRARRVPCPAGSLLLWDSRLLHQGWRAGARLCQPVCWEPRERRDAAALRRKHWMAVTGSPSSHSASEGRVQTHAPQVRNKAVPGGATRLPLRDTIVPYGLKPGAEQAWWEAQEALWVTHDSPWGPDSRPTANSMDSEFALSLLRPEIAEAL
eukprot:TRINITY_DN3961_c0_g1_i1.p1 TRINITY_DN3961_c0_g1~~TRINITY_DN3961_c0_g1_i1.p1  ORF type:complete len:514 (+),score=147.38 TRINITY_DN3961_c0_g1_i1:165-1544(+)